MILLAYIAYKVKEIQQQLEPQSDSYTRTGEAIDRWLEKRIQKRLDKADADSCCAHDFSENYCVCCMNEHERCRIQD
jgi:hypothetical protein